MKNIIFKYPIILALFYSCSNSVKIQVNNEYCGKVYIVLDSNNSSGSSIFIDSDGIGYLNSMLFKNDTNFKIIRAHKDITNLCEGQSSNIITSKEYEVEFLTFFVPCKNEINEDDKYWEDKESSQNSNAEFENLIKEVKINIIKQ